MSPRRRAREKPLDDPGSLPDPGQHVVSGEERELRPDEAGWGGDWFEPTGAGTRPYRSPWLHTRDELAWLDRLIHMRVQAVQRKEPDPLANLQGLVISDAEIGEILHTPVGGQPAEHVTGDLEREAEQLRQAIDLRLEATTAAGVTLPLPFLASLFGLTRGEQHVLLIALAPEIHRRYDKLFGYLHDDVTRRRPSVDLAMDLLCRSAAERIALRPLFDPVAPLRRYRLIRLLDPDPPQPLRARPLALDDRIAGYLLGLDGVDPLISDHIRWLQPGESSERPDADPVVLERFRSSIRAYFRDDAGARPNLALYLRGVHGSGRRDLARAVGEELRLPTLLIDVERLVTTGFPVAEALWHAAREALLRPAVLLVEGFDALLEPEAERARGVQTLLDALPQFCRCSILSGTRRFHWRSPVGEIAFVDVEVAGPDEAQLANYWQERGEALAPSIEGPALRSLAGRFRFSRGQVDDALRGAYAQALWRSPNDTQVVEADIQRASRSLSSGALGRMAHRIEPRYEWADIVLPVAQREQLRSISDQVRYRHVVLGDWGFGRKLSLGKGVSALFAGPPGTGKTMAAEVVANDLGLELYKIDLSQVVSKYIGETEKNLDRVFSAAESGSAILFFDEADALFGKRSEVRDSHDRYANVEISYLLQKMEEYEGIAILATNLRRHMDEAFMRRLQFVIEFPFPNRVEREEIWRVTLPHELPLDDQVDLAVLARDVRLAGGGIKNVSLTAAHLAAADGGVVSMSHLWEASRREFEKLGRDFDPGAQAETTE